MHARVEAALRPLWDARDRPTSGHTFLNHLGKPYTDTRKLVVQGGNPLASVHATACKRAKIEDFTVHDWRHHRSKKSSCSRLCGKATRPQNWRAGHNRS